MTAIVEVSKTVKAVGGAVAAPNPWTIAMAAKQLWEDYKRAFARPKQVLVIFDLKLARLGASFDRPAKI